MARTAKSETPATPRKRVGSVETARWMIRELKELAALGRAGAAERARRWLDVYPELKGEMPELTDLAAKAEAAWAKAAGGGDPLVERAAREEAARLRAEVLGPAPTALDRLLVSALVVAHMSYNLAAAVAAQPADSAAVREVRDRRLAAAQRRLLDAARAWERVTKARAAGLRPRGHLKVFAPDGHAKRA